MSMLQPQRNVGTVAYVVLDQARCHDIFAYILRFPVEDVEEGKTVYGAADPTTYNVRGKNYLVDKVKFPSRPAMFKLVAAGSYSSSKPMPHIASRCPTLKKAVSTPGVPFSFIVIWLIPGPPYYSVTMVFARAIPPGVDKKFDKIFSEFINGSDDARRRRFKFIPNIVKCPFLVSAALRTLGGMRPVITGNKLSQVGRSFPCFICVSAVPRPTR